MEVGPHQRHQGQCLPSLGSGSGFHINTMVSGAGISHEDGCFRHVGFQVAVCGGDVSIGHLTTLLAATNQHMMIIMLVVVEVVIMVVVVVVVVVVMIVITASVISPES